MKLELRIPSSEEFQQICQSIAEYELDNRGLEAEQFIAAFNSGKLVGFGRLRQHPDCTELCSLGVITSLRRRGIGKAIVNALIQKAPSTLYLSCIIPDFFIPAGFRITEDYPSSMKDKLSYCTSELVVPEPYVVMVLRR